MPRDILMKIPEESISWSNFYAFQKEISSIYPSAYDLRSRTKLLEVVAEELGENYLVLDVDASAGSFGNKLSFPMIAYRTMDIDTSLPHAYFSLDNIAETVNMYHPNRYWQDPDKKTPFSYEVRGIALLAAGYKTERLCRILNDQIFRNCLGYTSHCICTGISMLTLLIQWSQ